MLYNSPKTTLSCVCVILLHVTGVIICSTIGPEINFTPPLEFPSDGLHNMKIIQATDATTNNLSDVSTLDFGNNDIMARDESIRRLQESFKRQLDESVIKSPSHSQPINVIAKISENYTENKYYNNRIEENWSSIALTLIVLTILSISVLACSALCLKKVENLKISKRQLLIEDCDDSAMSDLIHIHHV